MAPRSRATAAVKVLSKFSSRITVTSSSTKRCMSQRKPVMSPEWLISLRPKRWSTNQPQA